MAISESDLRTVTFDQPPLVEMALAVAFRPVAKMTSLRLAELWQRAFRQDYPEAEEQTGKVDMPIEPGVLGPAPGLKLPSLEDFAPSARLWFLDGHREYLVQV